MFYIVSIMNPFRFHISSYGYHPGCSVPSFTPTVGSHASSLSTPSHCYPFRLFSPWKKGQKGNMNIRFTLTCDARSLASLVRVRVIVGAARSPHVKLRCLWHYSRRLFHILSFFVLNSASHCGAYCGSFGYFCGRSLSLLPFQNPHTPLPSDLCSE